MKTGKLVIGLAVALTMAVLAGCGSSPAGQGGKQQRLEFEKIGSDPVQQPDWVNNVPDSPTTLSLIGSAGKYATATGNTGARYYAEENGRTQLVDYYGTLMANKARTHAATNGISSEVFAPQTIGQQLNERISQNVAQALAPRSYYTVIYRDNTANREAYEVYVLMQIEKTLVRRIIDSYGQEQAAEFKKKAAAEQDAARRQQLQKAAEFFGGNLSSTLDL
jgi:hypothetical protein